MPWFRVDHLFAFHPKTVLAGNAALGLWVRAGSWCVGQTNDGFIPRAVARALGTAGQARRLVASGLWDENDDGYTFHDWAEWQPRPPDPEKRRKYLSPDMRRMVIARDGLMCRLCSNEVAAEDVHIDHITPVALGGTNELTNLQVTHSRCNIAKGANV